MTAMSDAAFDLEIPSASVVLRLLDAIGDPAFMADCDGRVVLQGAASIALLGEGAAGAPISRWLPELQGRAGLDAALAKFGVTPGRGTRSVPNRTRLLDASGKEHQVALGLCKTALDGEPAYLVLMRDLSDLQRAETQMLDAQRLVRSLLQSTSEGYVLLDADGMVLDTNPALQAMCGYSAMDLQETRFARLLDGDAALDTWRQLLEKLAQGRPASAELALRQGHSGCVLGLFKGAPLLDAENRQIGIFGLITDVTEAKAREREIEQLAYYDPLTGLANRALLQERLTQAMRVSRRYGRRFALLFLDLDKFKHINDTLNHMLGDQLLQEIARRIRQLVRSSDVVARFGGDEFVVGLLEPRRIEDAALVAQKVLDVVAQPVEIDGHVLEVTTSVGISVYPDDADSAETLIRNADLAMYQAKTAGRSRYSYFTPALNDSVQRRHMLEQQMRNAVAQDEFLLHYQPKVDSATGNIVGAEALIRWQNPALGFVSPADFIPLAEETGFILQIGDWVIQHACRQVARWKEQGYAPVPVALNISGHQLRRADFMDNLQALVEQSGIAPDMLELEITESVLMEDVESAIALLDQLRAQGFALSIDDFGTGYSSFSYLTRLPVHTLKIDRSFVMGVPHHQNAATIVSAIVGMAKNLGLRIVAEGVETEAQAAYLQALGCDELQGYLFSKPVNAEHFTQFLAGALEFAFGSKRLF